MGDSPARLVAGRGLSPHDEYRLTQPKTGIGRAANNEIVIDDVEVSRRHAQIIRQPDGTYVVEDLGSTNGTFVNGRRSVGLTALRNGDVIDLGESISLTFLHPDIEDTPSSSEWEYQSPADEPFRERPPEPEPAWPAPPAAKIERYREPSEEVFPDSQPSISRRRLLFGCSCAFLSIIFLCVAALFFLDAYDQGRLLYCGGLRPFFQIVLGPFGFSPICP